MGKHTFAGWLQHEITAARCALLKLYEEKDRMLYVEKRQLEEKYMAAVGSFEEEVIKEEMECELLIAKHKMVQVKLNRREEINEAEIDLEIEKMRGELMREAAGSGGGDRNYQELAPEKMNELQEIYSKIVQACHPQMHTNLPETHRQLYDKAQEAYRRHDLNALRLIWDMLTSAEDGGEGIQLALEISMGVGGEDGEDEQIRDYSTDYTLAASLYSCFVPMENEAPVLEEWEHYKAEIRLEMMLMEKAREEYPFSAEKMLSSPEETAAYKAELELRLKNAKQQREKLSSEIREMIGSAPKHG